MSPNLDDITPKYICYKYYFEVPKMKQLLIKMYASMKILTGQGSTVCVENLNIYVDGHCLDREAMFRGYQIECLT